MPSLPPRIEVSQIGAGVGEHTLISVMLGTRTVGHIKAGFGAFTSTGRLYGASYIEVDARRRGAGIGALLLARLRAEIPAGVTRLHFWQVTSLGMLQLIERVYGPVSSDMDRERIELRLPPRMDLRTLRRSRGVNVFVDLDVDVSR